MQVRHLPNRDRRRRSVTTLKCASAHVPRFFTGSDPPISDRQLPFRPPTVTQAVYTARRLAVARDGFVGRRGRCEFRRYVPQAWDFERHLLRLGCEVFRDDGVGGQAAEGA
jgi:hypothetical protein